MKTSRRLLIAFVGWIVLGLAVVAREGLNAGGSLLFNAWSLYALIAGIWVIFPLLKIADAAARKEQSRESSHSDKS